MSYSELGVTLTIAIPRCGMVYLDPGDLKWKPYVQTWLDSKFPVKLLDTTKVYDILL